MSLLTTWDLVRDGKFIDMWFRVDGVLIGAHRIVIMSKSNYLYREYLSNGCDVIDLFGIPITVVWAYLVVVYDVHSTSEHRRYKLSSVDEDIQLLTLLHDTKIINPSWDHILGILYGNIPSERFVEYYKTLVKCNMNHGPALRTLIWPNITTKTDIMGIGYMHVEELLRNYPKDYSETLRYNVVRRAITLGMHGELLQFVDMTRYTGTKPSDAITGLI